MRKVMVCCIIATAFSFSPASVNTGEKLQWMRLEEAETALKVERKPVIIDLYTKWCGWCKIMDKKTYSNKNVAEYVKHRFYSVRLDAETKEILSWSGKTFSYNPAYSTNEFAIYITQGRLSYPTTVIIPPDGSVPQAIPGYLAPREIEVILKYFGEGKYRQIAFDEYQKRFTPTW